MSALAERDDLEEKRRAARQSEATRQADAGGNRTAARGATPLPGGGRLGPQGQVPAGLSSEGAASLASQVTKPDEIKALAGARATPEPGERDAKEEGATQGKAPEPTTETKPAEPGADSAPTPGPEVAPTESDVEQKATEPGGEEPATEPDVEQKATEPGGEEPATEPDVEQKATEPGGEEPATGPEEDREAKAPEGEQKATEPEGEQKATAPKGEQTATEPAKKPAAGGTPEPGAKGVKPGPETQAVSTTATQAPGAGGPTPGPAAAGGGAAFDIDFIAREYAIHEQWAALPAGRDDVSREYTAAQVKEAGGGGPTLTVEQRRELLHKALGGGALSGATQFGLGMAIKLGVNQGSKLLVTKGLGRAVPFVGVAFAGWDLYTYFSQDKHKAMKGLGKTWSVLTGKASRKDWISFLKGVKSLTELLGSILGVAAAICGVIAALTSWTVLGGVSFGALAAGLGIASGILSLVGTLLSGAIAYLEYQEVLEMEGSPEEILKVIGDFEADVASTTEGALNAPGKVKDVSSKAKSIQKKTVEETAAPAREEAKTPPPQVTPEKTDAPVGRAESRILLPGQGGEAGGIVKPQAPAGFQMSEGGLYVPKPAGGGGLAKPGGLVVPGAPAGYERSAGGLYVPAGSQAPAATPSVSQATPAVSQATPAISQATPAVSQATSTPSVGGATAPAGNYRVTGNLDPSNAGRGMNRGLAREVGTALRTGQGQYAPEKPVKASDFEGLQKAYQSGKAPNVKRTVQQLDNWLGDGRGTNVGPVVLSDKVPVEAFAQGELATTRADVTFRPEGSSGTLIRRASLAPFPNPPYSLEGTVKRLERTAHLAYQEEGLAAAMQVGQEGQQKLQAELGPGGTAEQLSSLYRQYDQSIATQAAEVQQKDAKVTTSEQLLANERAKDQQTRGKTDEVLNNQAARKIGQATSDPFLSTVVRGGAGVAKAVGGAINWVASNVFGADEDVVDTRAIDNVRKLFSEAPKAREGRDRMGGQAGQVGGTAAQTAPAVAANRAKVTETKGKHAGAKGKVVTFQAAGKRTTDTLHTEKSSLARENEALEAKRQQVRAEREAEFSAYTSEMGALSLWAVQHRSVRDANNVLLTDMAAPPKAAELTPEARARVDGAKATMGSARSAIEQARAQLTGMAEKASEGLRKAAAQAGTTPDSVQPICARLASEAQAAHERRLSPQLATLGSLEGMLGSVGAERLPGVIEAAERTARAAEVAVRDTTAAFQRFAEKTTQATVQALQAEVERARQSARTAANL